MTKHPARPLSRNEEIKRNSRFLRGTLAEGLRRAETGALSEDDTQLTKFHGIYQQDDRDLRPERAKKRMEKAFIFMAGLRIPAGVLTPAQWLCVLLFGLGAYLMYWSRTQPMIGKVKPADAPAG